MRGVSPRRKLQRRGKQAEAVSPSLSFSSLSLSLATCRQKRLFARGCSRSRFSRENSRRLLPPSLLPGGSFTPGNAKLIERTRRRANERERSPSSIARRRGAKGARGRARRKNSARVNAAGALRLQQQHLCDRHDNR